MNVKKAGLVSVLVAAVVLGGVFSVGGCKKSEEPASTEPSGGSEMEAMEIEQTICPVMGAAINKDIYVEYQGKKVYFCCEACKDAFNEAPEKYISKLPQFQQ